MLKTLLASTILLAACSDPPNAPAPSIDASTDVAADDNMPDAGRCGCGAELVPRCIEAGLFVVGDEADPDLCAFEASCPGPTEYISPPIKCGTLPDGVRCCVLGH